MEPNEGTKRGRPAQRVMREGIAISTGAAKVWDELMSVYPHQPTNRELAASTGYTTRMVQLLLCELEQLELVERTYTPRNGTRALCLNPGLLAAKRGI